MRIIANPPSRLLLLPVKIDKFFSGRGSLVRLSDHKPRITCMRLFPLGDTSLFRSETQREENILVTSSYDHSIHLWWKGSAQRPEVRIVTWNNDDLSTDVLPVHGFEHYKAEDCLLAHAPFSGSSYVGGQWAVGDEPLYYIVSPKDVVITKPRDTEDHIAWLLQHGWHEKALAAVEAGQGRSELLDEVLFHIL